MSDFWLGYTLGKSGHSEDPLVQIYGILLLGVLGVAAWHLWILMSVFGWHTAVKTILSCALIGGPLFGLEWFFRAVPMFFSIGLMAACFALAYGWLAFQFTRDFIWMATTGTFAGLLGAYMGYSAWRES